jgi:hypothetical protein
MPRRALGIAVGAAALGLGCSGPPAVRLDEAYQRDVTGPRIDNQQFDRVLRTFVRGDGRVDYPGLLAAPDDLDGWLAEIATVDFVSLGRDQRLALLINAYNACTLRLVLDHWPLASIKDIPTADRWAARRWRVAGMLLSLDDIEHEYLRAKFREPRIHFAINCASVGCPPLRREAFDADRLEQQLEQQAVAVHADPTWLRLDESEGTVWLTRLYQWYGSDFAQVGGSVLDHAARYTPHLHRLLAQGRSLRIAWLDYDWSINAAR